MPMTRCETCQAPLPADDPEGDCPRCLLGLGLEPSLSSPGPARFTVPSPEELRPLFPQFELGELLGQGGMGAVYAARQLNLDREVALKVLPPELGRDPEFSERFAREARAMARLDHPGVLGIHDFGEAGPYHYLVLERVAGTTLRELCAAGPPGVDEALRLLRELCAAVAYAHERDVVHRDLKPENVLVDDSGRVRVADFGLAKAVDAARETLAPSLTGPGVAVGTPHYIAPERLEGAGDADPRADVYALGVVAYELLTGRLPLGRFPEPAEVVAELPNGANAAILAALEHDPDRRPGSAGALLEALEATPTGPRRPPRSAGAGPAGEHAPARAGTRLLWALIGAGIAVFVAGFLPWGTITARPKITGGAAFDLLGGADRLLASPMTVELTAWNAEQSLGVLTAPTWLICVYGLLIAILAGLRRGDVVRTSAWVLLPLAELGLLQSAHFVVLMVRPERGEGTLGIGPLACVAAFATATALALTLAAIDHGWGPWRRRPKASRASKAYARVQTRLAPAKKPYGLARVKAEARGRAIRARWRRDHEQPRAEPAGDPEAGADEGAE